VLYNKWNVWLININIIFSYIKKKKNNKKKKKIAKKKMKKKKKRKKKKKKNNITLNITEYIYEDVIIY